MTKDVDKILDIIITLFDMILGVFKGIKKLRKYFKKKKLTLSKTTI